MATSTFRGPLRVGPPSAIGVVSCVRQLDLVPLAAANTDLQLVMPRCQILGFTQMTRTAYTGATVALSLGITPGGAEIVSAADIRAQGFRQPLTVVATGVPLLFNFTGGTLFARLAQTTPTAVGLGALFVEYIPLDDILAA
jgi:hypothetical protein